MCTKTSYGYKLIEQEIMPDRIHLFISAPPTVALQIYS
ncbi:transposase [Serpentinicella alkaliphila]|nr:transposase [Serpentinicella alkaliphila]